MMANNKCSISPHGCTLINCFSDNSDGLSQEASKLTSIIVTKKVLCDLEMLAIGAFSPLTGFTGEKDYKSILESMRLSSGLIWPVPITLQVNEETYNNIKNKNKIVLKNEKVEPVAVVSITEIYKGDLEKEALSVFKTNELKHPGVKYLFESGNYCIAGEVKVLKHTYDEFPEYNTGCEGTRKAFKEKGWKRIVAFQTRNPVHRAHEYLLKVALETVDGLLLHPTMGETKGDDIPANIRMKCYQTILEKYFPENRTLLCMMPASMRYGGPREAVLHAIIRKNYGCTHFIVGRDHAGVGNYYGTYDAQKIFDELASGELGINLLFFEHSFYCKSCGEMASFKTCPHDKSNHITLSGTKVREMLKNGEIPPVEFTRPEIAKILIDSMRVTEPAKK